MRYDHLQDLAPTDFKRLTGVRSETFAAMLTALQREARSFGRPTKLSLADQLLLTLMYWREYRTQFHIARAYGVREATVCRTIMRVEQTLLRSGEFRLPGKKVLRQPDTQLTVVVLDATETPVERPQKNNAVPTAASRTARMGKSATPKRAK